MKKKKSRITVVKRVGRFTGTSHRRGRRLNNTRMCVRPFDFYYKCRTTTRRRAVRTSVCGGGFDNE